MTLCHILPERRGWVNRIILNCIGRRGFWFGDLVSMSIPSSCRALPQISLTLSRYTTLSSIAPGRSSRLRTVSPQAYWGNILTGHPTFIRLCEGVHWRTSLMSSSLLLKLCPACLLRLNFIVSLMGGRYSLSYCPYSRVRPGVVVPFSVLYIGQIGRFRNVMCLVRSSAKIKTSLKRTIQKV